MIEKKITITCDICGEELTIWKKVKAEVMCKAGYEDIRVTNMHFTTCEYDMCEKCFTNLKNIIKENRKAKKQKK